jgi:gliding motility-associated-like protein
MPNAFTPNGDGIDDLVYPIVVGENAHITSFLIYNRWGQLVYSPNTKSDTEGWNGNFVNTPQPVGTYFYIIEYNDFDSPKVLKGDILLLR